MEFYIKGCRLTINYSFVLVLSIAAFYDADAINKTLLYSSLHELGHLIMLAACGKFPTQIKLSCYGFAISYNADLSRLSEAFVLAAGPATNAILWLFLKDSINLVLFFVNMLPIYPLDFGRALRLYFPKASHCISVCALVLVAVCGVYAMVFYKKFSMLPIIVYLIFYCINYD